MSDALVHEVSEPVATAVCLHGIGLGPWMWEAWLPLFAAEKVRVVAPDLHDASEGGIEGVVAQVHRLCVDIGGPISLVGHSFGGLVAQLLASRRDFHAVALVCPLPPGQVRLLPAPLSTLRVAAQALRGAPVRIPFDLYRKGGFNLLSEPDAQRAYDLVRPWPNRLVRELAQRPVVDPHAVVTPMLVAMGKQDGLLPWRKLRVLGDLYEAVVWRYDDLGHMPPLEPGGARMGRDVARFCASPWRPRVLESEGYGPEEGVGHEERRRRRGDAMKARSAYGQRSSARET